MKKINKLTHIFVFMSLISLLFFISCGTEEEIPDESITLTLSSSSVTVGSTITFTATSNIGGDVSSQAVFFVNGNQISGNTFSPETVNPENEVRATFNGLESNIAYFASTEEDTQPEGYTQKLLLEDYTGTWCGYCPRMVTIVEYVTNYSDRVIPVAIHCPGAPTDPWAYEFANQLSHPNNYNVLGRPEGRYNRIHTVDMFQGTQPCPNDASAYQAQVDSFLNQSAPLGLAINSSLSGNNLSINVKVGFDTDSVPNARLVVYLLEDGLSYNQVNYFTGQSATCDPDFDYVNLPNPIPNFPQEHVLLKSYTDIFGDVIPQNQIANGNIWARDFNVSLPDNVTNSQNLSIVAFVLGNGDQISNRPVLNVQRAKVGVNQDFD